MKWDVFRELGEFAIKIKVIANSKRIETEEKFIILPKRSFVSGKPMMFCKVVEIKRYYYPTKSEEFHETYYLTKKEFAYLKLKGKL